MKEESERMTKTATDEEDRNEQEKDENERNKGGEDNLF